MTTHAIGRNVPGFLPDGDVEFFGDWMEARDAYVETLTLEIDWLLGQGGDPMPEKNQRDKRILEEMLVQVRKSEPFQTFEVYLPGPNQVIWLQESPE